jgi:hypothetical protein
VPQSWLSQRFDVIRQDKLSSVDGGARLTSPVQGKAAARAGSKVYLWVIARPAKSLRCNV